MPQVGYYHLETKQKYLKFFKKNVFLKLILTPPLVFLKFFLRFSVSSGSQPPPPFSEGKTKRTWGISSRSLTNRHLQQVCVRYVCHYLIIFHFKFSISLVTIEAEHQIWQFAHARATTVRLPLRVDVFQPNIRSNTFGPRKQKLHKIHNSTLFVPVLTLSV